MNNVIEQMVEIPLGIDSALKMITEDYEVMIDPGYHDFLSAEWANETSQSAETT